MTRPGDPDFGRPVASVEPVYHDDSQTPAEAIETARHEAGECLLRLFYRSDAKGLLIMREVLGHILAPGSTVTALSRRLGTSRKTIYKHIRRVQAALSGNTRPIGKNAVSR